MGQSRVRVELRIHVDPHKGYDVYGSPHTSLVLQERRIVDDSKVEGAVREAVIAVQVRAEAGLHATLPAEEEPAKSDFVFDSGSDVGYSRYDFESGPPRA
jgi:hypothetical protein